MANLPESLENRFNLYLNILPVVDSVGQLLCLIVGICLLTVGIVTASMRFSKSIQSNNKSQNYANIQHYPGSGDARDCEMTEKCFIENGGTCDEINLNEEQNYMLEDEPALSEDDEMDSDTKSLSCGEDETDGSLKLVSI